MAYRDPSGGADPFPKAAVPLYPAREFDLKVIGRRQETAEIVTFDFEPVRPDAAFRHLPGQAIVLKFPMADGIAARTFSIASSGLNPRHLSVTMKAAKTGHATRWAHENLKTGDTLQARGPFGRFSVAFEPGRPLALIGGGSGFVPVMSMVRWLHGRGETTNLAAVQFASRGSDLLFDAELSKIDQDLPNFHRIDCVSSVAVGESWRGYRGRPDRAMLRSMLPDLAQRSVFCCGPAGFMEAVKRVFLAEGGQKQRFFTESFGTPVKASPSNPMPVNPVSDGRTVQFRGKTFSASADVFLANAAAAANLRIPTGCQEGECGTCKLKLVEGSVEMRQKGGLSDREVADGFILACCSKARSDLVLKDPA